MLDVIVVLWLGASPELAQHRTDIAGWASPRRLSPVAPTAPPMSGYDPGLVERIEALLEEARATPAASAGPNTFERIDALLSAHPELPQAAWLLAERHAIEAHALGTRAEASPEGRRELEARRRELEARRRELEGERAEPLEMASPTDAEVASAPPPAPAPATAAALVNPAAPSGVRALDRVFVDGVDGASLGPGLHHVQVLRGTQRVWVAWVEGGATAELGARDPSTACSALDLAGVVDAPEAPHPAPGVLCQRWLAARPAALGGTELAECTASRCERWHIAGRAPPGAGAVAAPTRLDEDAAAWPAWATWGLVGAGVVAATGVVLWQAGAFERSAPGTEYVFTGPSAAAYRF